MTIMMKKRFLLLFMIIIHGNVIQSLPQNYPMENHVKTRSVSEGNEFLQNLLYNHRMYILNCNSMIPKTKLFVNITDSSLCKFTRMEGPTKQDNRGNQENPMEIERTPSEPMPSQGEASPGSKTGQN